MYAGALSVYASEYVASRSLHNCHTFVLPLSATQQRPRTGQIYNARYERSRFGRDTYDYMRYVNVYNQRNRPRRIRTALPCNVYDCALLLGSCNGFQSLPTAERFQSRTLREYARSMHSGFRNTAVYRPVLIRGLERHTMGLRKNTYSSRRNRSRVPHIGLADRFDVFNLPLLHRKTAERKSAGKQFRAIKLKYKGECI